MGRAPAFRPRRDNKYPATPSSPSLMEDNDKAGPLQDYEDPMDLYTPIMNFVRSGQASYDALPAAISHDLSRAIALLDRAAVEGLPQAIDRLGSVYMTGEGLPRDPERGVALYQAAAEAGDISALYNMGVAYRLGEGVQTKAGESNFTMAVRWWQKAAQCGHAKAQCSLGVAYWEGLEGASEDDKPDRTTAVKWFRLAANQDNLRAQYSLGYACYTGDGMPKGRVDYKEANKWWTLAANKGYARAQHCVGCLHFHGRGVPKNEDIAIEWYSLSATQGYPQAIVALESIAKGGDLHTDLTQPKEDAEHQSYAQVIEKRAEDIESLIRAAEVANFREKLNNIRHPTRIDLSLDTAKAFKSSRPVSAPVRVGKKTNLDPISTTSKGKSKKAPSSGALRNEKLKQGS